MKKTLATSTAKQQAPHHPRNKPTKKDSQSPSQPKKATNDVMAHLGIIMHPLSTEKSIRLMEAENTLLFVVSPQSTKSSVKAAIEHLLGCHVEHVRTFNTHLGQKKAYITFAPDTPAIDIATNLGVM